MKVGYVADLIVLDKDIFTIDEEEIKDIKWKTMVDGEFVYVRYIYNRLKNMSMVANPCSYFN